MEHGHFICIIPLRVSLSIITNSQPPHTHRFQVKFLMNSSPIPIGLIHQSSDWSITANMASEVLFPVYLLQEPLHCFHSWTFLDKARCQLRSQRSKSSEDTHSLAICSCYFDIEVANIARPDVFIVAPLQVSRSY